MQRVITILFLLVLSQFAFSQKAVLHLDKPYYTAGESVWYKLYLPETYKTLDAKVEVQISSSNGDIIDAYFLDLNAKGAINGYWNVPYTINTGVYALSFVTHEPKQQRSNIIATYTVDIYNDLERLDQSVAAPSVPGESPSLGNSSSLQIKTNKAVYQPREDVTIDVIIKDASGNPISGECSVSIVNMDLVGKNEVVKAIKVQNIGQVPSWTPSDKLVHKGTITDTSSSPIKINVLGFYSDQTQQMYLGKSNTEGIYSVGTDDFYGTIQAQGVGYILNEFEQIDVKPAKKGISAKGAVGYSDTIEEYITASRLNKKIRQYYKAPTTIEVDMVKNEVLERKPNADYDFDDYEPFPDASSFFNESNSSRLKFSSQDGILEAVMYNPKGVKRNFKFPNPPTFIVDGKVTKDANLVGRMPFTDVETAELYFLSKNIKSTFGTNGGSGYAILKTKKGDFTLRQEENDDIINIHGLQRPAIFTSNQLADNTNVPNFQSTVYWNPTLGISNGSVKVSVPQSDDISTYLITVVAKTASGEIVSKALPYEVNISK